jgi:hypothetical protein
LAELEDIVETSLDLGDGLIEAALNGGLPFLWRDSSKALSSFSVFCLISGSDSSESSDYYSLLGFIATFFVKINVLPVPLASSRCFIRSALVEAMTCFVSSMIIFLSVASIFSLALISRLFSK